MFATQTTKNIRSQYHYDEFGNITSEAYYDSNGVETTDENEIIKIQILYAGYQYAEESKYYNLHARYYDPQTARFLQQDTYRGTIADPLSLNLYTYCHNEPLIYYDPTGHSEKSALDLIGEIIAAKEIYEEEQKWRDGLWPVDPRRNFRTKAQKEAASSAETARSSLKSTEAYKDTTLKQAIDSYLDKEYGGTMADVLDLQKTIISYNSLINEKNRIANQKSIPTVEPHSNELTGNAYVTAEKMKEFGWANPDQKLADEVNAALSMFGINKGEYATEQIILFMAIAGHEAGMGNYNYIEAGVSSPYRGAGAIQLTGKANYGAFDKYLTKHLKGYNGEIMKSNEPYKVVAEKYAWMAAAWYWTEESRDIKGRIDKYLDFGYELYDSFIVQSAFVQAYRGDDEDYRKIAAGQYKPINYSAVYSGVYTDKNGTQKTHKVVDIHVINGGTVVSSNNWIDRKEKFEKAFKVFGGK